MTCYIYAAAGQIYTAQWLVNSDAGGMLVGKKDRNGDTPAHDAAENGYVNYSVSLLQYPHTVLNVLEIS